MKSLLVGVMLAIAVPAAAQPSLVDQKFLKEAAGGGRAEIARGRLAVEKASRPEVKEFAQQMIDERTRTGERLTAVLADQGVSIAGEMPTDAKRSYEKLSKLSGAEFDREYLKDMLDDRRKDVRSFEEQARNGKDPALRQFAEAALPALREHLAQAERLARR